MKPLLNFLFKWMVLLTLGSIVICTLELLALFMWDRRFMRMCEDVKDFILYNENK